MSLPAMYVETWAQLEIEEIKQNNRSGSANWHNFLIYNYVNKPERIKLGPRFYGARFFCTHTTKEMI